jgi:predicted DNA-binding ribbon-helix-helix protein
LEKQRGLVRSFRFDANFYRLLVEGARRKHVPVTRFIVDLLTARLKLDPLTSLFRAIVLDENLFRAVIKWVPTEEIKSMGAESAKGNVPVVLELLKAVGVKPSFVEFIRDVLAECNWLEFREEPTKEVRRFVLHHDYGPEWSVFLEAYLSAAYEMFNKSSRDQGKPRIVATDKLVRVELPGSVLAVNKGQ